MSTYSATVAAATLNTSQDIMTLVPAANRRIWITECSVGGLGTASAASIIQLLAITTAGTTGGGGITPEPWDRFAPASASTVSTTWSVQPTVAAVPFVSIPVNANGGLYRWVARPGQEINIIGSQTGFLGLSVRPALNGGATYCVTLTWIEDPI